MRKTIAPKPPSFASLVQHFFTEYLIAQRAVSPRTVACYRDALMLFLDFASHKLGKSPTSLKLADIQPDLILAFLDHLEHERHNAVRSRNLLRRRSRLVQAAVRSMRCAAPRCRLRGNPLRRSCRPCCRAIFLDGKLTARRFNMEVQPQLVLLQKTLLNIEGLGRQLYPDLDLWQTAKPFLERWMSEQVGPRAFVRNLRANVPVWSETLPEIPHQLLHQVLDQAANGRLRVEWTSEDLKKLRRELRTANRSQRCSHTRCRVGDCRGADSWLAWNMPQRLRRCQTER